MVKPIPDGYTAITPYLLVDDVKKELDFITNGLGGKVDFKMEMPDGSIMHAEVNINGAKAMVGKAHPPYEAVKSMLYVYTTDAEALYAKAVAAGGKAEHPLKKQFYGDLNGNVVSPNGIHWSIGQHVEDVSHEELKKRVMSMGKPC